ncbi:MAG: tetratricopeptide repeat protein [Chthonomonadales bacterium]
MSRRPGYWALGIPLALGALFLAALPRIREWSIRSRSTAELMALALEDPGNAEIQFELGRKLLAENHPEDAARAFAAAFAARPQRPDYGAMQIRSLLRAGLPAEALVAADTYLRRNTANPLLLAAAASAYYALGNLEAAEGGYRKSLAAAPSNADAWAGLAMVLADMHNLRDALDAARRAKALAPDMPEADVALAHVMDLSGDTAKAIALLRHAVARDRGYVRAWEFLCSALLRAPQSPEFCRDAILRDAEAAAPRSAIIPYCRGIYSMQARHYDQAVASFRTALQRNPVYPDALYNLSLAYAFCGDRRASAVARRRFTRLSGYLRRVTEIQIRLSRDPHQPALWHTLEELARRNGDVHRAEYARIRGEALHRR